MGTTNGRDDPANRFLAYCKAVGVLVAAASGIVGMAISIRTTYREPKENLAKQIHKVVNVQLKDLSQDLRKEHDANEHQHALIGKDISSIRGEMKLVVQLLELSRQRRPTHAKRVLKDLSNKVKKDPAVKSSSQKKVRPPVRALPSISDVQQQARAAYKEDS